MILDDHEMREIKRRLAELEEVVERMTSQPWRPKRSPAPVPESNPTTANAALPAQVTARWLPTGGATISEWMIPTYSLGEETSTSMAYLSQYQNLLPVLTWGQRFALREGQGLLVKQGTVASVGSIGFLVAFTLE